MKFFIDFDGVLLDTNDLVVKEIIKEIYEDGLNEIFEEIDWEELYKKAPVINNNINILKKIQNNYNITIITKIKHLNEGIEKIKYLKENNINVPIILVPINNNKTDLFIPDNNCILIDDDINNINDWIQKNGKGYHYKKTTPISEIIKSHYN